MLIKDLSASLELDTKALRAVRGGGDQANGASQANFQNMFTVNNVANGLVAGGPITVQSDIDNTQTASNYSYQDNFKGLSIDLGYPYPYAVAL